MSSFKIKDALALFPQAKFVGNPEVTITRPIGIMDALAGEFSDGVTWLADKKSAQIEVEQLRVGLVILSAAAYQSLQKAKSNFLIAENPRAVFFKIVENFYKTRRPAKIESSAFVDETAQVGQNCYIGRNVVIERNCKIGDYTTILHNTSVLEGTTIGDYVTIGCNNTIGNYGFGYEKDEEGNYFVLQHVGHVVIGNHVEIHNNTCIDRGVLGITEIQENAKIDNLVHIAHGVVVGRNALVIANAMVAGSAIIGENSWIAPSVSIKNSAKIAANTMTGIGAVILKDTESNQTYIGNPATTLEEYKNWSAVKKNLTKPPKGQD